MWPEQRGRWQVVLEARKVDMAGCAYRLIRKVTSRGSLAVARTHWWAPICGSRLCVFQKHRGLVAPQLLSEIM